MEPSAARSLVWGVLAVACVIQTSLLVAFTVTHLQRQQQLQLSYQELTQRARRLLYSCVSHDGLNITQAISGQGYDDEQHVRRTRQAQPDPYTSQVIQEQEAMLVRHCDSDTKLCLPGLKGDMGITGAQGGAGVVGTKGEPGQKGTLGSTGLTGDVGPSGAQGGTGPKGETGTQGPVGEKGEEGPQGSQGDPGVKGTAGINGVKGVVGAKGDLGAVGQKGDQGVQGPSGSKGEMGPKGLRGQEGAQGPTGERGYVAGKNCSCFTRPTPHGAATVDMLAFPGSTVTLTCPISGSPVPTVLWSRPNGLPLGAKRLGEELILTDMKTGDVGPYTCTASNILGYNSSVINLRLTDLDCDFESGLCGWSQSTEDQLNWHLRQGMTDTLVTGPSADHTFGTVAGQYVHLESSDGVQGDVADLTTPLLRLNGPVCLTFWYNMYGADIDTLSVVAKSATGTETELWSQSGEQGQDWIQTQVSVTPETVGNQSQIIFRARKALGIEGDIAIDDVELTSGLCRSPVGTASCDFEVDMCQWTSSGQWIWGVNRGPSGRPNTGPLADHSGDVTRFYAYANGLLAPAAGYEGRLTSPFFDATTDVCVEFFYHMYGTGVGTLTLIEKAQDGTEEALWQRTGNQGPQWQEAHLTLPQSSSLNSLVFVVTRGSDRVSDVALDDVNVTSGACAPKGDLGCDFEQLTLCTWMQSTIDQLNWDLQVASAGGLIGAPAADHTLQTAGGHYVSVSGVGQSANSRAILQSRIVPRLATYCLSLWYSIPSSQSGKIDIYRQVYTSLTERLSQITYTGPGWRHVSLTVPVYYTDYSLAIAAVPGVGGNASPLAVDDISLTSGQCQ